MNVYKFGGASVKDADRIKNVASIIKNQDVDNLVVVISAMGKTTNLLEEVVEAYFNNDIKQLSQLLNQLKQNHQVIIDELFGEKAFELHSFYSLINKLNQKLEITPSLNYDYEYDQIIGFGELLSTNIVSEYFNSIGLANQWVDARSIIKTDEVYRDAGIEWDLTSRFIRESINFEDSKMYITQGFIGSSQNNLTTSLGREGSDYSAAILGHVLDAEDVTIWKDVTGVLNADPQWYPNALPIPEMSYWEAVELTYYGAKVIHPKTLRPLQLKNIPLRVKSFIDPTHQGTVVKQLEEEDVYAPIYILKEKQLFISISAKDFSFIVEDNLSQIFSLLSEYRVKVNLMQHSALNFSICINQRRDQEQVIEKLQERYNVRYNLDVELVTIRHYNQDAIDKVIKDKEIIDSQYTRKTVRYVVKTSPWKFN